MSEYIDKNIKIIKNHLKLRKKKVSKLNKISITQEFKEWDQTKIEKIWTLPDLTRSERLDNFCRSIKKEIN